MLQTHGSRGPSAGPNNLEIQALWQFTVGGQKNPKRCGVLENCRKNMLQVGFAGAGWQQLCKNDDGFVAMAYQQHFWN